MTSNKQYVFGLHAVEALLKRQPERVIRLCVFEERRDKKLDALLSLARKLGITIDPASRHELDRMTQEANHQGVVAFCHESRIYAENDLKQLLQHLDVPPFLLILDGVQDPHNLGACFRSADAAGVHAIIVPKDNAVGITPVVSKVACGAAETMPFIQVTNLARTMEQLKEAGIWLYGADGEAKQSLYQAKLTGATGIVLGAEGSGMRRLTRELCDVLLKIPMHGSVASLNVSVATGIFLFEALRQRGLV
jgi:23S rRNA (guanosine2251-2'-O)-methyltransferase